jgi:hypothetical protein
MKENLELFPNEELQSQGSVSIPEPQPIEDAEWCFQFFNNDPIVFAFSNEGEKSAPLTLTIEATEGQGMTFQQNGMTFRLFPRPISEETKLERTKENQK